VEEDPETGEPVLSEEEEESEEKFSDEFLLYEVQANDVVPRIARYYDVTVKQLKKDNQFLEQLTVAGDVLFIRKPSTTKPYTRKLDLSDIEYYMMLCLELAMDYRDFFDMEPIKMSTGTFYMAQTDAEIEDLGGSFKIERSYNSIAPYFRSEFGMGWNSLAGEKIMVLQNGTIIYVREDGKGLIFTKAEGKTYKAPEGYDYELKAVNSLDAKVEAAAGGDDTADTDNDADETNEDMAASENTSVSSTARSMASSEEEEDDAEETDADDTEEEDADEDGEVEAVAASTGWEISQPDGTVKQFNSNGLLVSEKDLKGYRGCS